MMNINSEKSLGIHNYVHVLTHVFSLFIKYIVNSIATLDIFSVPLGKIHEKEKKELMIKMNFMVAMYLVSNKKKSVKLLILLDVV